jgi:hypothetical protein
MGTTAPARQHGITQICIAYLTAEDESARFTSLSALVKYCKKAVGHLYPPSEYETIASIKTDPRLKDGLPAFFSDDASTRTTEFIQDWLLEFLLPYRNATPEELTQEAEKGTFRLIGRMCRFALVKRIRKALSKKRGVRVSRMLENPIETDDGNAEPLINFVARPDVIDPVIWIDNHKRALQDKGIYEVCGSLASRHLDRDRQATTKLAELWGVSLRQAQNRRRDAISRIRGELRSDPLIRELFEVLSDWSDRRRLPILAVSPSPEATANSKLLEEAAKEGREFYRWCQESDETPK